MVIVYFILHSNKYIEYLLIINVSFKLKFVKTLSEQPNRILILNLLIEKQTRIFIAVLIGFYQLLTNAFLL